VSPKNKKGKSGPQTGIHLSESSPRTPHTLKAYWLTSHHLQLIYSANNLRRAGTIMPGTAAAEELLNNVKIDGSSFRQLKILLQSTARAVSPFLDLLIIRRKQVADSILVYTS